MRTIILIRHAKSSWDNPGQPDFERTLNERGKRNAAEMAIRLRKRLPEIDLFVSSTATRAKKTAELFMKEYKSDSDKLMLVPELYQAEPDSFLSTISGLSDVYQSVAIFAHNPGITYFINRLTQVHIDHLPTCGIFAVCSTLETWIVFEEAEKEFLFFDYPKAAADQA